MIKKLSVTNIGPSDQVDIAFGSRLNVVTGDNDLGKSFLLDPELPKRMCTQDKNLNKYSSNPLV